MNTPTPTLMYWEDYQVFLLQNSLSDLSPERREETKHAVLDIASWLDGAHQTVSMSAVQLVGIAAQLKDMAYTPRDRKRIEDLRESIKRLLEAADSIDRAKVHVDYIADGPQGLRTDVSVNAQKVDNNR